MKHLKSAIPDFMHFKPSKRIYCIWNPKSLHRNGQPHHQHNMIADAWSFPCDIYKDISFDISIFDIPHPFFFSPISIGKIFRKFPKLNHIFLGLMMMIVTQKILPRYYNPGSHIRLRCVVRRALIKNATVKWSIDLLMM